MLCHLATVSKSNYNGFLYAKRLRTPLKMRISCVNGNQLYSTPHDIDQRDFRMKKDMAANELGFCFLSFSPSLYMTKLA